jgi:predicted enzyme related to lactoylglutathione lyase
MANPTANNVGGANPLARHGGLSYLEIPAPDPSRSAAFYERVLGWKIDPRAPGDFRFSDGDGLLIGRFANSHRVAPEAGLLPNFYVESIESAVACVAANGGEIVKPIYAEGDVHVARIRDPAGNLLGLWQFAG